ncbi:hypothetical protein HDU96_011117 [Phlyctochytrium bullatum]|nr:hypothetical protein HDU96_011117 [Phlyctochytrium bullatum]
MVPAAKSSKPVLSDQTNRIVERLERLVQQHLTADKEGSLESRHAKPPIDICVEPEEKALDRSRRPSAYPCRIPEHVTLAKPRRVRKYDVRNNYFKVTIGAAATSTSAKQPATSRATGGTVKEDASVPNGRLANTKDPAKDDQHLKDLAELRTLITKNLSHGRRRSTFVKNSAQSLSSLNPAASFVELSNIDNVVRSVLKEIAAERRKKLKLRCFEPTR